MYCILLILNHQLILNSKQTVLDEGKGEYSIGISQKSKRGWKWKYVGITLVELCSSDDDDDEVQWISALSQRGPFSGSLPTTWVVILKQGFSSQPSLGSTVSTPKDRREGGAVQESPVPTDSAALGGWGACRGLLQWRRHSCEAQPTAARWPRPCLCRSQPGALPGRSGHGARGSVEAGQSPTGSAQQSEGPWGAPERRGPARTQSSPAVGVRPRRLPQGGHETSIDGQQSGQGRRSRGAPEESVLLTGAREACLAKPKGLDLSLPEETGGGATNPPAWASSEEATGAAAKFCNLIRRSARAKLPKGDRTTAAAAAAWAQAALPADPLPTPCAMGLGTQALCGATLLLLLAASEETVPRLTLRYGSQRRPLNYFEMPGITNYTTMLLNPDGSILYVGAREMLLALNTSAFSPGSQHQRLPWAAEEEKKRQCVFKGKDPQRDCFNYIKILLQLNGTHLYTCGTSAFSPTCTYINVADFSLKRDASGKLVLEDGKGRCPFDPEYRSTAIMVDGELYTGTVSNFQGNEPTILRSHGSRPVIKTENSLNWLQDPFFVGSAYLRESLPSSDPSRDDDKIYFFFSESGKEFDFFEDTIVSRIARVCKGDVGGERVLQRRWTTFLKAQLLCSRPEDGFPFNVLQDMFVLTPGEPWTETVFYGVFTSQWDGKGPRGAAVCAFSMSDVKEAFNGLYKEVNRETQQWYTDTHPVPDPRPGACINSHTRQMKITSSLQMPDRVLNYLKDHFLMNSPVRSRPLLWQGHYRYQQLSVQRVQGLHHTYDVLFLGTDDGRLHKAVTTGGHVHIIEEIQLFPAGQPVLELLLDPAQGWLYAASYAALAQVPVANCSLYQTCGECVLSRDPYCAWSGQACLPSASPHTTTLWVQDVEDGDAMRLCQNSSLVLNRPTAKESPCQLVALHPNAVKLLPCPMLSNLGSRHWLYNGVSVNTSFLVLPDGELVLLGNPDQAGLYECWSQEGSFRQRMASYCVTMEHSLPDWLVPVQNPLETISTSRSTSAATAGGISALLEGKTYWTEFLVMCVLFGITMMLLTLFVLHQHRNTMKVFLKQGTCTRTKTSRKAALPAESLPLNGTNLPSALPDHKGYQALNDSHVASTPGHEVPAHPGMAFLVSDRRPLSIHDSFVEVLAPSQRPRVRLGSEIRDSVV